MSGLRPTGAVADRNCMNPDCVAEEGDRHQGDCTPDDPGVCGADAGQTCDFAEDHTHTPYCDIHCPLDDEPAEGRVPSNDLNIRQVGTTDEELPCGCIPYEHEHYGPCADETAPARTSSSTTTPKQT